MADTLKILGQNAPAAGANGDVYTVPAVTSAVGASLVICNTNAAATKVRVFARIAGAAAAVGNAIVYDLTIGANETMALTLGLSLATTDKVTTYSLAGGVTFTLTGVEVT